MVNRIRLAPLRFCYYCGNECIGGIPIEKWGTWRQKVKPRICLDCQVQLALFTWLDTQIDKINWARKRKDKYNNDPLYKAKIQQSNYNYHSKNRDKINAKSIQYQRSITPEQKRRRNEYHIKWYRNEYNTNPEFRAKTLARQRARYRRKTKS